MISPSTDKLLVSRKRLEHAELETERRSSKMAGREKKLFPVFPQLSRSQGKDQACYADCLGLTCTVGIEKTVKAQVR